MEMLDHGDDVMEYSAIRDCCGHGLFLRGKFDELQRISILLNRTREEVARDHMTRAEFRADMQQLLDRFDRIERKIDSLSGSRHAVNQ